MHFSRRHSHGSRIFALFALIAQLTFATAGPLADAREPNSTRVHFDGPRQHHAAHDPDTCTLCLAMHSNSLPVSQPIVATVALVRAIALAPVAGRSHSHTAPSLQTARAPPVRA